MFRIRKELFIKRWCLNTRFNQADFWHFGDTRQTVGILSNLLGILSNLLGILSNLLGILSNLLGILSNLLVILNI